MTREDLLHVKALDHWLKRQLDVQTTGDVKVVEFFYSDRILEANY